MLSNDVCYEDSLLAHDVIMLSSKLVPHLEDAFS